MFIFIVFNLDKELIAEYIYYELSGYWYPIILDLQLLLVLLLLLVLFGFYWMKWQILKLVFNFRWNFSKMVQNEIREKKWIHGFFH